MAARRPSVFIGSSTEGKDVAEHLQLALDDECEATVWTQNVFTLGRDALSSLVARTRASDFAVLVLTADDEVTTRGAAHPAPRDNCIFEAGVFIGSLGPARTFLVHCSDDELSIPSDLNGITTARFRRRSDANLQAAVGPVALEIKRAIREVGLEAAADSELSHDDVIASHSATSTFAPHTSQASSAPRAWRSSPSGCAAQ